MDFKQIPLREDVSEKRFANDFNTSQRMEVLDFVNNKENDQPASATTFRKFRRAVGGEVFTADKNRDVLQKLEHNPSPHKKRKLTNESGLFSKTSAKRFKPNFTPLSRYVKQVMKNVKPLNRKISYPIDRQKFKLFQELNNIVEGKFLTECSDTVETANVVSHLLSLSEDTQLECSFISDIPSVKGAFIEIIKKWRSEKLLEKMLNGQIIDVLAPTSTRPSIKTDNTSKTCNLEFCSDLTKLSGEPPILLECEKNDDSEKSIIDSLKIEVFRQVYQYLNFLAEQIKLSDDSVKGASFEFNSHKEESLKTIKNNAVSDRQYSVLSTDSLTSKSLEPVENSQFSDQSVFRHNTTVASHSGLEFSDQDKNYDLQYDPFDLQDQLSEENLDAEKVETAATESIGNWKELDKPDVPSEDQTEHISSNNNSNKPTVPTISQMDFKSFKQRVSAIDDNDARKILKNGLSTSTLGLTSLSSNYVSFPKMEKINKDFENDRLFKDIDIHDNDSSGYEKINELEKVDSKKVLLIEPEQKIKSNKIDHDLDEDAFSHKRIVRIEEKEEDFVEKIKKGKHLITNVDTAEPKSVFVATEPEKQDPVPISSTTTPQAISIKFFNNKDKSKTGLISSAEDTQLEKLNPYMCGPSTDIHRVYRIMGRDRFRGIYDRATPRDKCFFNPYMIRWSLLKKFISKDYNHRYAHTWPYLEWMHYSKFSSKILEPEYALIWALVLSWNDARLYIQGKVENSEDDDKTDSDESTGPINVEELLLKHEKAKSQDDKKEDEDINRDNDKEAEKGVETVTETTAENVQDSSKVEQEMPALKPPPIPPFLMETSENNKEERLSIETLVQMNEYGSIVKSTTQEQDQAREEAEARKKLLRKTRLQQALKAAVKAKKAQADDIPPNLSSSTNLSHSSETKKPSIKTSSVKRLSSKSHAPLFKPKLGSVPDSINLATSEEVDSSLQCIMRAFYKASNTVASRAFPGIIIAEQLFPDKGSKQIPHFSSLSLFAKNLFYRQRDESKPSSKHNKEPDRHRSETPEDNSDRETYSRKHKDRQNSDNKRYRSDDISRSSSTSHRRDDRRNSYHARDRYKDYPEHHRSSGSSKDYYSSKDRYYQDERDRRRLSDKEKYLQFKYSQLHSSLRRQTSDRRTFYDDYENDRHRHGYRSRYSDSHRRSRDRYASESSSSSRSRSHSFSPSPRRLKSPVIGKSVDEKKLNETTKILSALNKSPENDKLSEEINVYNKDFANKNDIDTEENSPDSFVRNDNCLSQNNQELNFKEQDLNEAVSTSVELSKPQSVVIKSSQNTVVSTISSINLQSSIAPITSSQCAMKSPEAPDRANNKSSTSDSFCGSFKPVNDTSSLPEKTISSSIYQPTHCRVSLSVSKALHSKSSLTVSPAAVADEPKGLRCPISVFISSDDTVTAQPVISHLPTVSLSGASQISISPKNDSVISSPPKALVSASLNTPSDNDQNFTSTSSTSVVSTVETKTDTFCEKTISVSTNLSNCLDANPASSASVLNSAETLHDVVSSQLSSTNTSSTIKTVNAVTTSSSAPQISKALKSAILSQLPQTCTPSAADASTPKPLGVPATNDSSSTKKKTQTSKKSKWSQMDKDGAANVAAMIATCSAHSQLQLPNDSKSLNVTASNIGTESLQSPLNTITKLIGLKQTIDTSKNSEFVSSTVSSTISLLTVPPPPPITLTSPQTPSHTQLGDLETGNSHVENSKGEKQLTHSPSANTTNGTGSFQGPPKDKKTPPLPPEHSAPPLPPETIKPICYPTEGYNALAERAKHYQMHGSYPAPQQQPVSPAHVQEAKPSTHSFPANLVHGPPPSVPSADLATPPAVDPSAVQWNPNVPPPNLQQHPPVWPPNHPPATPVHPAENQTVQWQQQPPQAGGPHPPPPPPRFPSEWASQPPPRPQNWPASNAPAAGQWGRGRMPPPAQEDSPPGYNNPPEPTRGGFTVRGGRGGMCRGGYQPRRPFTRPPLPFGAENIGKASKLSVVLADSKKPICGGISQLLSTMPGVKLVDPMSAPLIASKPSPDHQIVVLTHQEEPEALQRLPNLTVLRRTPDVRFGTFSSLESIRERRFDPISVSGGVIFPDDEIICSMNPEMLTEFLSLLLDLNESRREYWTVRVHSHIIDLLHDINESMESRRPLERNDSEWKRFRQLIDILRQHPVVELMPPHECDHGVHVVSEYLRCFTRWQTDITHLHQRQMMVLTDVPPSHPSLVNFNKNGFRVLSYADFISNILGTTPGIQTPYQIPGHFNKTGQNYWDAPLSNSTEQIKLHNS